MEHYLKNWLGEFPNLRFILSAEDKKVLDTINPYKYKDHNLTRETEVIRIINDHKPQAWKWVRLYPNLKNLPAEDYAILDHIVTTDYMTEITEDDVRRIIAYRKENIRKEKAKQVEDNARLYYQNHADEIAEEERTRTRLSKVPQWTTVIGTSFVTAGIAMHGTAIAPLPYFIIGIPTIVLPWLVCSLAMKRLDYNSITPRPSKDDTKLGFLSVAFIALFYIGLLGLGVLLGTVFVWERLGWGSAEPVFWTGLLSIIGAASLFILFAIATPSKE